ncbi:MAG: MBOAT family protein [Flavobacteriales bacterium]|jgi:D-alanyl-lipoteichoic acid acyltransferase DltB (MBOAT superfamily)|nr:MBOAT family protein [Flavobacteriales bacterium]
MLFDSLDFALFFPLVFVLYWFVTKRSLRVQNIMLLAASYYFYACWDWRFLFLLAFSTALDHVSGLLIHAGRTKARKRTWLIISVGINLGFLGLFKYYNFFAESFADLMGVFGLAMDPVLLSVVLPVGISFYTFHGLSYVFDVYNERIKPVRNVVDYALFVGFFPLLVAGPIERATHLLPQLQKPRTFRREQAVSGLRQLLWGLFKKMVIADGCGVLVNGIFADPAAHGPGTLALGAVLFAFQIYGDFSGYSDIALGTARLLGIELLQNFSFPYFSRDIAEFWRRWHISLSSWFRDYLYIPLGGSRQGRWKSVRNIFIIFLVSGFWHGADWTFIAWGALHAVYFLPLLLMGRNRDNLRVVAEGRLLPTAREALRMTVTFALVCVAWVLFRAESMAAAGDYLLGMVSAGPAAPTAVDIGPLALLLPFFMVVEWCGREQRFATEVMGDRWPRPVRWGAYASIVFLIGMFMGTEQIPFIYFQF